MKKYTAPEWMQKSEFRTNLENIVNGIIQHNIAKGNHGNKIYAPLRIIDERGLVWNARYYDGLYYARYNENRKTVDELHPLASGFQSGLSMADELNQADKIIKWNPHFDEPNVCDIVDMRESKTTE